MFEIKKISATEFDQLMAERSDIFAPLEQTPLWDSVDSRMVLPRTVQGLFGYYRDSDLVATARIVTFKARMRNMTLINQGPLWFIEPTVALERELIDTLVAQCKKFSLYIRMQLHFPQQEFSAKKAVPALEQFMYDRAQWLDLTPSEDELLKSFSSTTRRRIKQAVKAGVEVRKIPAADAVSAMEKDMLPILRETTARNDFTARSEDTYTAMLAGLSEENVSLYAAYVEDRPVCWLLATESYGHSQYPYAAGNKEGRDTYASFLLQWEVIKEMKAHGNFIWDMTGVESDEFPQFKNVTQFKRGFTKNEVTLPVHCDVPTQALKYKAVTSALSLKRKLR